MIKKLSIFLLALSVVAIAQSRSVWLIARHPVTGSEIRICARDTATCDAAIDAIRAGRWGRDLEAYGLSCEPTAADCTGGK